MHPRLNVFITSFLISAILIFALYYYGSNELADAILLALIAGLVIGIILSFTIPFLKKGREETKQK